MAPPSTKPRSCKVCFTPLGMGVNSINGMCSDCAESNDGPDDDERDPMLDWDTGHSGGDR